MILSLTPASSFSLKRARGVTENSFTRTQYTVVQLNLAKVGHCKHGRYESEVPGGMDERVEHFSKHRH